MTSGARVAAGLAFALALGVAAGAQAQSARAGCDAQLRGERALVDVRLDGFFDKDLIKLVRLGLEGRVELEVRLVRRRSFWFDEEVASTLRKLVVVFDKTRGVFVIGGERTLVDPAVLVLERLPLPVSPSDVASRDKLEAQVTARLQVVTVASLGRVASWLAGGAPEDAAAKGAHRESPPSRSALTRSLLSALTDDLTRVAEARCAVR